jgi:hypothetical protein
LTGRFEVLFSSSWGSSTPDDARLLTPPTAALFQEKVVPVVALAGEYEKIVLLQIDVGATVPVREGRGLTITDTA